MLLKNRTTYFFKVKFVPSYTLHVLTNTYRYLLHGVDRYDF